MSGYANSREFFDIAYCSTPKYKMIMKDKRIRINKVMVGWSDGREVHLPPTVRRSVARLGSDPMEEYHRRVREGYELQTPCAIRQDEALIIEAEADECLGQGKILDALRLLIFAAGTVIEVDDDYRELLEPLLNPPSHPTIAVFLRLNERCEELCRQHPRLRPVYEDSSVYDDYRLVLHRYRDWL